MLPLGTPLPSFTLRDAVTDREVSSDQLAGRRAVLVMFLCNHCPYVKHVLDGLTQLDRDYRDRDVALVAINSNDIQNYPQDGPSHMRALAEERGWSFPFLLDADQTVARSFRAACTPDFFLFDKAGELVYRGQLDDSRPGSDAPVTGRDLRAALDATLAGTPVPADQRPSVGCNIKWKPGHEPDA
jgi:thiol-disulfide isomerase/thioredoxin